MELFISDAQPADTLSLALELFATYVRAPQRDIVQLTALAPNTLAALKIDTVPVLVKTESEPQPDNTVVSRQVLLTNPFSIMLEISRACYLEEIMLAKKDSLARTEISKFIEMVGRLPAAELAAQVNTHMADRMFLVGENITAADVLLLAAVAPHFSALTADEKKAMPHAFRWVDHVQHLPGMLE